MLITIKPHSTLAQFFSEKELSVDINSYTDIPRYLDSMQPAFFNYVKEQRTNRVEEGYVLLDSNLRELTYEDLYIRAVREGDVVYIVPAIFGGGGKRGGLLGVAALFAMFLFFPVGAGALGGLGGAAAGGAATAAGKTAAVAAGAGGGLFSNLPPFLSNILVNLGLSMLSALFTKKQDDADAASRQNDMFGSLQNSTSSDTPVALHYGQVRVAGQLVSGYIQTINHSRNETVTVDGVIEGLRYTGGGAKGKGSWLFSSSSAFDTGTFDENYSYIAPTQYYSENSLYGILAFSNTTNSISTYDVRTSTPVFNSYSVDNTYLKGVRKPVVESHYIGADRKYMYTLSPGSNTVVSYDLSDENASVAGIVTNDAELHGVYDISIDTSANVAYVASKDSNTVTSINITNPYNMSIIDSYTDDSLLLDVRGVAFDSDTSTLYAVSYGSNTVSAIGTNSGVFTSVKSSLQDNTAFYTSTNLALDKVNKRLYVGSTTEGKIYALDVSDPNSIYVSDSFNAGGYSITAPVTELVTVFLAGRPHIAAIADSSTSIYIYDVTNIGANDWGSRIGPDTFGASAPANCTSISNRYNTLIITCAEANTVLGYNYTETEQIINYEERNNTRIIKTLEKVLSITSDEYLDGVSSAILVGA